MSAYINHLVEANEIQAIIAREDILSKDDEVLFKQGSELDPDALLNLEQCHLKCPLEDEIELKEEFTAESLEETLHQFINADPNFQSIYYLCDVDKQLSGCIKAFCQHKILCQKLTVLAIQLPHVFDEALFCAWMAVNVYSHEETPQEKLNHVFMSGLSHDLGLLDVAPEVIFSQAPLTREQWKMLERHPINGAKMLRAIGIPDRECIRAILEHHEYCDGTGFPYGKFEKQLNSLGRLLHMLSNAYAIYRKHFKVRQRSLYDMIPILQMATLTRGGLHSNLVVELFKATIPTSHCAIAEHSIPNAISRLRKSVSAITAFIDITEQFRKDTGIDHKQLNVLGIQKTALMIRTTLSNCGIINEAYLRWLDQVESECLTFAYRELEDVILMAQEIEFHIQRYHKQITSLHLAETDNELATLLETLQENIRATISEHGVAEDLLN